MDVAGALCLPRDHQCAQRNGQQWPAQCGPCHFPLKGFMVSSPTWLEEAFPQKTSVLDRQNTECPTTGSGQAVLFPLTTSGRVHSSWEKLHGAPIVRWALPGSRDSHLCFRQSSNVYPEALLPGSVLGCWGAAVRKTDRSPRSPNLHPTGTTLKKQINETILGRGKKWTRCHKRTRRVCMGMGVGLGWWRLAPLKNWS